MAYTLQQILGYVALGGTIQKTVSGIPNPLPPSFFSRTTKVIGNTARYTQVTGQRRTARHVKYGAPAVARELKDVATRDVELLHLFESQNIPPLIMQQLRNYDDYNVQKMGMTEVARQTKEFVQLFQNTRVAAVLQLLANGVLYWDRDGNLLPSSSGAKTTMDFNVSANNQNQLNGLLTGKWNNPSTDIPLFLRSLKQRAAQDHGYMPKIALYGINIPSYLTQNDYVLDYLARNPGQNAGFLQSAEIGQLFDFTWIPVYSSFFEDQNGTNQEIFHDDAVTFLPEPDSSWWDILEGSYLVPTNLNGVADGEAALASLKQVHGMFGYGVVTHNPVGVTTFYGDTFLPVLKNPDVAYMARVNW